MENHYKMKMSDKTYDILKGIAQYVLPGLGSMYFALSKIWGLPYPEQVVGTIAAVDAFLGALLGLTALKYKATQELGARIEKYTQSEIPELSVPTEQVPSNFGFTMTSQTYDILYWVAQVLLPAVGTLYFALSSLWGFPYGEQVVGTISALDVLLGALLGMSSAQYKQKLALAS